MRFARTVVLAAVLSVAIPAHGAEELPAPAPGAAAECRAGDPLANVHHPGRLEVLKPCIAVTGIVVRSYLSPDGDIKFNLKLDPADEHLLNQVNRDDQDGTLICEIVPADQPGCIPGERVKPQLGIIERFSQAIWGSYDFGICTGADVERPADGARVRVVGPHVIDHGHGWMEIHPVWAIEVMAAAN